MFKFFDCMINSIIIIVILLQTPQKYVGLSNFFIKTNLSPKLREYFFTIFIAFGILLYFRIAFALLLYNK